MVADKVVITKSKLDTLANAINTKGQVKNPTQLTIDGMTQFINTNMGTVSGNVTISTNGTHNVSWKENAIVNIPSKTKTWEYTVNAADRDSHENTITLVLNDDWIKANYNNDSLVITFRPKSAIVNGTYGTNNIISVICTNKSIVAAGENFIYGFMLMVDQVGSTNQTFNAIYNSCIETSINTGHIQATEGGDLKLFVTSTDNQYMPPTGTYEIVASIK